MAKTTVDCLRYASDEKKPKEKSQFVRPSFIENYGMLAISPPAVVPSAL